MRRAALLALVAACESGNHARTHDAGEASDGSTDTLPPPTADAPAGGVTIAVTLDGLPAANVPVYFQRADSTVVVATTTDANGTVGAALDPGGFVTVIEPNLGTGRAELATFAGVQPGDALHLDLRQPSIEVARQLALTIDADPSPGAESHHLLTPCGDFGMVPNVATTVRLIGCPAAVDVVVVSENDRLELVGSHFHAGVVLDGSAPIALTGPYLAPATTSFTYTQIPTGTTFVATHEDLATPAGPLFGANTGAIPAAGLAGTQVAIPTTIGTTAVIATAPFASGSGSEIVTDWAPAGGDYSVALAAALLPAYTSAGSYDLAAHAVTWTDAGATATAADAVRTTIEIVRPSFPEAIAWTWRLIAPHGGTTASYPVLPADGFDFNARDGDTVGVGELATAKLPNGYDADARTHGFADFRRLVTGANGRLVVETLADAMLKPGMPTARRR